MTGAPQRSRILAADIVRVGTSGLRARPTRAVLSALGIAIGIAAMIAVVGISTSSQARLNAQLASLGTNLLTVSPGQSLFGEQSTLPVSTVAKVGRVDGVQSVSSTASLADIFIYRSHLIDAGRTGGLTVKATDLGLLEVTGGTVKSGSWLNTATASYPTVVLGSTAAERLGIVSPGSLVWLGGKYFTVIGILDPVALVPDLDDSALVGQEVAGELLDFDGKPTVIYERSEDDAVDAIRELLPATVKPDAPEEVAVSRPSDVLAAKAATDQAFTGLLVGLGSVALLVGGIGVANTMVISVLERRREIGLRRALGATRGHIRTQFLTEALLLSALGGIAGAVLGAGVTALYATLRGWPIAIPPLVLASGILASLVIGAIAGLYPAIRAARTPPTSALNG